MSETLSLGTLTAPAPVSASPARGNFYHPELDVLRFFAFFMVFLGHLNYSVYDPVFPHHMFIWNVCIAVARTGSAGVTLFFALSSFLITELLLQEQTKTGTIHLRDFYVRRILRIWPLYFFFLLIARPLISHFILWDPFNWQYLVAFLLLAGNWMFVFRGVSGSFGDPLWSISVEEQFYLVWPFVIRQFRRHIPSVAYAMLLVSGVARIGVLAYPFGNLALNMWCNTATRLDAFALGALAAYYLHGREVNMSRSSRVLLIILSVFTLLLSGRYGDHVNDRAPVTYPLEALCCLVLLVAVLMPLRSWVPGLPGRVFVYLGRISYGLYVFHVLYVRLMLPKAQTNFVGANLMALGMTIGTAALSYVVLEKPFLRLKQRFTYVKSRI